MVGVRLQFRWCIGSIPRSEPVSQKPSKSSSRTQSRIPKRIPLLSRWRLRLRRKMVLQPEHRFVQSEGVPVLAHFADEHSIIGRCRTRERTRQFLGIAISVQHQERAHLMQVQELIVVA
jgi:hypothetical protein